MTAASRISCGAGFAIGGLGLLPVIAEKLGAEGDSFLYALVSAAVQLLFYTLPLCLVACGIGVGLSLVVLKGSRGAGGWWVLTGWCFASTGIGAFVWWVADFLHGLESLGGL